MNRQDKRKIILLAALLIFPVFKPFLSPVTVIMGTLQGVMVGGMVIYISLFLSSLFFGRLFCGWMCPMGGIQEYCSLVVNKKPKYRKLKKIKYILNTILVIAIIIAVIKAGSIKQVDFMYQSSKIIIPELQQYIIYYAGVALIILPSLILGKRAFCLYICGLAPFTIVATKIKELIGYPSLYLKTDRCTNCKLCNKKCPMSIDVAGRVKKGHISDSKCIICGECVDICPENVISYEFGLMKNDQLL